MVEAPSPNGPTDDAAPAVFRSWAWILYDGMILAVLVVLAAGTLLGGAPAEVPLLGLVCVTAFALYIHAILSDLAPPHTRGPHFSWPASTKRAASSGERF